MVCTFAQVGASVAIKLWVCTYLLRGVIKFRACTFLLRGAIKRGACVFASFLRLGVARLRARAFASFQRSLLSGVTKRRPYATFP